MSISIRSIGKLGGYGIFLAAVATSPVFAQSALTPEQLTLRVERLTEITQRAEVKLGELQTLVEKMSADMDRLSRLLDNRAMLEMIQQVDELGEEISLLTGEIEVQSNDINDLKKRQRELYLDIDRRLRDLEISARAAIPTESIPVPELPSPESDTVAQESQSTPSTNSGAAEPSSDTEVGSSEPASRTPSVTQSEEKAAYQTAYVTLKEGRYKKAKTEFKTFLTRFPKSSYAGNAQYWLGEAHYVTRNFEQGIAEFKGVLNNYPSSNKVPDAMLKLGYTFYELKQFAQAKAILSDLRKRFPKATASRLAAKRLDRMRKEGY